MSVPPLSFAPMAVPVVGKAAPNDEAVPPVPPKLVIGLPEPSRIVTQSAIVSLPEYWTIEGT